MGLESAEEVGVVMVVVVVGLEDLRVATEDEGLSRDCGDRKDSWTDSQSVLSVRRT